MLAPGLGGGDDELDAASPRDRECRVVLEATGAVVVLGGGGGGARQVGQTLYVTPTAAGQVIEVG